MYYYYQQDREGAYADASGERYTILCCSKIVCPPGQTPEMNGWQMFPSLSAALSSRGLILCEERPGLVFTLRSEKELT